MFLKADAADGVAFGIALAHLWRDRLLCDVQLVADGQTFEAHRVVLAAVSPYLQELVCASHVNEAGFARIEIDDMDADLLGMVLEFVYTFRCNVPDDAGHAPAQRQVRG